MKRKRQSSSGQKEPGSDAVTKFLRTIASRPASPLFTAWQKDLLRARFHRYLIENSPKNNELLSIAKFFEQFRESPAIIGSIYDVVFNATPKAICEKFRRFLKNEQEISTEYLEALKSFLVCEEIISIEELNDRFNAYGEMLAKLFYTSYLLTNA